MDVCWWYMSWRRLTERKCLLDWREGRWSWEQQSFEEIVQELVDGHQRLPQIHRAARFCRDSNSWISPRLWGFHTTAAYSIVGLIMALYAAYLASRVQPNIDLRKLFKDLVPLLTTNLQCFDQVNFESTCTPRYFTGLLQEIG